MWSGEIKPVSAVADVYECGRESDTTYLIDSHGEPLVKHITMAWILTRIGACVTPLSIIVHTRLKEPLQTACGSGIESKYDVLFV